MLNAWFVGFTGTLEKTDANARMVSEMSNVELTRLRTLHFSIRTSHGAVGRSETHRARGRRMVAHFEKSREVIGDEKLEIIAAELITQV